MTITEHFTRQRTVAEHVDIREENSEPDMLAAAVAASDLLSALRVPLDSESLAETPARLARALKEIITPVAFTATTFPNDENYRQLVIQCDIPFRSICEHHMLAFTGIAHVGYIPGPRILGLSKLARLVQHFASRPQVQERLTQQVADWLLSNLAAEGVGVVMSAEHTCMTLRGVLATGARTVTSAMHGVLQESPTARSEFMTLISLK
jgi:GTP cyclohydrolase I